MAVTTLSDVIVPELFEPYAVNKTVERSALVQSGIISHIPEYDRLASQASPLIKMPFYEDLTGDSQQIVEGVDLQENKITSNQDIATIIRRGNMWAATDLSAALSGKDPMGVIASLVADFWVRDLQKELIAILDGVFDSATMANHILDISAETGNAAKWSAEAFLDAQQLLGDAKSRLTAVCMHSAVETALRKQQLIQTVQPATDLAFSTYQGKRVIIDDGCPVDTTNGIYTTYLFGEGALALGYGNPEGHVPVEIDRDKKKGSGVDYLINRKAYILHPRGIKFTNTSVAHIEGPSRAELAMATNWQRVYEPKQIRMVAFKHKI